MRSIWRNRPLTCCKMGGSFLPLRFRAAVTGISPNGVPSKFWRRNELIILVCTERSSIPAGTRSWRMPTRTWRCCREENSFPRRCITSCGSQERTECMPDIYPVIRRHMAVFRMPEQYAIALFNAVGVGTPVTVHGRTPTGRYVGQSRPTFPWGPNRFGDPRFDPRFVRPPPPWWWR